MNNTLTTLREILQTLDDGFYMSGSKAATKLRPLIASMEAQPEQEPVMIYEGRCIIDCGDTGHQHVTMLKMIPAGTKLYTHPAQPSEQPCPYCDGTGDVHGLDGEWRGQCNCGAQPEQERDALAAGNKVLREAVQQALDVLKENHQWHQEYDYVDGYPESFMEKQNTEVITFLSAALKEAK